MIRALLRHTSKVCGSDDFVTDIATTSCSNCGATKSGEFCAICGQNSRNYLRAAYRIVGDLLSETFEVDSRLFISLRHLILKPGFLSNEFSAGRRARYVSPARMYLVVSLIFFFTLSVTQRDSIGLDAEGNPVDLSESLFSMEDVDSKEGLRAALEAAGESRRAELIDVLTEHGVDASRLEAELERLEAELAESVETTEQKAGETNESEMTDPAQEAPASRELKINLDLGEEDSELEARLEQKFKDMASRPADALEDFLENLPVMMFILLPFAAMLLKLAYPRRFYSEHFVFALHLHSFYYLLLTVMLFLPEQADASTGSEGSAVWEWVSNGLVMISVLYAFIALKSTYRQSIGRTLAKGVGLAFGYSILLGIGMLATGVVTFIYY
jgi:hypothetical protein